MNIRWEYRDGRQLLRALCFGVPALAVFLVVLAFSPFPGSPSDVRTIGGPVSAGASPYGLFREAMGAPISSVMELTPTLTIVEGDSRSNDYQLERDACCVGN